MGVTGLWRLIEPAGKPVPVETLENKVLAVDISIWLHQMVKGYQDAKGAPLPNAHLMGLFQRLCKLLYFRIKPVFVFDGGFPDLKKETIAKRQDSKTKYHSESERLKRELALLLSKKTAISSLLGKEISPKKGVSNPNTNNDDIFKLPALPESTQEAESESEDEDSSSSSIIDLHSVDIESNTFKTLPVKEKYDLLIELKETRKMNSWGKLNELPKKSDNFSDFQMQRLLKRRKVQECLEETEKEMGDSGMSLNELESLLNEEGIDTKIDVIPTRRIASNDNTRFLLINNVKQALLDAKKKKEQQNNPGTSKDDEKIVKEEKFIVKDELEEDLEKAIKMSLECDENDVPEIVLKIDKPKVRDELEEDLEKAIKMSLECVENETSNCTSKTDDSWTSALTDSEYSKTDSEEGDGFEQPDISSAKAYIMQYSDFTNRAIEKIITSKQPPRKTQTNTPNCDKIIDELNKEKSVILDKVDLSSDEDCPKMHDKSMNFEKSCIDGKETESCEADIDLTQASVLYVENPAPDVIAIDTSEEETNISDSNLNKNNNSVAKDHQQMGKIDGSIVPNENSIKLEVVSSEVFEEAPIKKIQTTNLIESNSSDDEFEDVPEIENQSVKPVVQLTLDMRQPCDEDDIFADVFTNTEINTIAPIQKIDLPHNIESSKSNVEPNELEKDLTKKAASKKGPTIVTNTHDVEKNISCQSKKNNDRSTPNIAKQTDYLGPSTSQINFDQKSTEIKLNASKEEDIGGTSKNPEEIQQIISTEKLNEMAEVVANEEQNLIQEKGRLDRIGRNITEQMTKEAQELLQLFGIPYIVAPMEAEAQCAFLENVKLTDGTITDDSDIWLFGGKTVYKNFFNQKKHVLQFLSERIEKSFNLTREQLVLLALLVGSDYTTGVDGVGPVTAMEILASFPFNKKLFLNETSKQARYQQVIAGMQEFKNWVRAGKRTDNTSLKKKLRNITINDDFPSIRVVQAYLEPNVEKSEDKFSWGEIDITILRDYTKAKFGWSQNKLDEIMKPVLKRLQERKSQKTVHDYFKRKVEFQSLEDQMSKRVKAAVQKMGPELAISEIAAIDGDLQTISGNPSKPARKRRVNKNNTEKRNTKNTTAGSSKKIRITTGTEVEDPNIEGIAHVEETASGLDIIIPKTDRFQEIIPQREKDKQCLLQNKMKAIEIFRKTKIDRKKKIQKRKILLPKDKAELSESSDDN